MLLVVVGMIGGASSIAKLCAVWSDGVLREVAGWLKIPVETTISRIFKDVTEKQISQLESVTHRLRAQIWRKANRAGVSKVGLNPVQWIDIDSTVDSVCGTQEILQAWFRTGNAYTSKCVVEFVKQLLAHLPNKIRLIIRADSGYFVGALLDLLDTHKHGYLIKVKLKNLELSII